MNILFAASEATPFIKSGGLGDVMGALPKKLSEINDNNVCVFLPFYSSVKSMTGAEFLFSMNVPLAWRSIYAGVFRKVQNEITYYFIDNNYYFARDCYGYGDDGERFAFFCKAVLEAIVEATKNGATSVIGGGDSVSAAKKFCKAEDFTHVSTGGGASLEFIEGKVLPGVAALDEV